MQAFGSGATAYLREDFCGKSGKEKRGRGVCECYCYHTQSFIHSFIPYFVVNTSHFRKKKA